MTIGEAVRASRGEMSRARFSKAILDKTGLFISAEMVQRVEEGAVQCHISRTILALLGYDIGLAPLVLPENILEAIRNPGSVCREENGGVDSPPV